MRLSLGGRRRSAHGGLRESGNQSPGQTASKQSDDEFRIRHRRERQTADQKKSSVMATASMPMDSIASETTPLLPFHTSVGRSIARRWSHGGATTATEIAGPLIDVVQHDQDVDTTQLEPERSDIMSAKDSITSFRSWKSTARSVAVYSSSDSSSSEHESERGEDEDAVVTTLADKGNWLRARWRRLKEPRWVRRIKESRCVRRVNELRMVRSIRSVDINAGDALLLLMGVVAGCVCLGLFIYTQISYRKREGCYWGC